VRAGWNQAGEEAQQQQQQQPPAPPKPVAVDKVTVDGITVTVEQMNEPAAFNDKDINGTKRTGVGVQLVFTFSENGKPLSGATGVEKVDNNKGSEVQQNPEPVALDKNGRASDYVTNSAPTPKNRAEANALYQQVSGRFTTEQKLTLNVTTASGTKIEVTQRLARKNARRFEFTGQQRRFPQGEVVFRFKKLVNFYS